MKPFPVICTCTDFPYQLLSNSFNGWDGLRSVEYTILLKDLYHAYIENIYCNMSALAKHIWKVRDNL